MALSFADKNVGWLAAGKAVMKTSDGGEHWTSLHAFPTDLKYIDFVSVNRGWAATDTSVFRTTDGGVDWEVVTNGLPSVRKIDFVDSLNGWLLEGGMYIGGDLLQTNDGGQSWQGVTQPCPSRTRILSISFVTGTLGWAACDLQKTTSIYQTADGGASWQPVLAPVTAANPQSYTGVFGTARDLWFLDETHGWMVIYSSGLQGEYTSATQDGGLTWAPALQAPSSVQHGSSSRALFVSPPVAYVVHGGSATLDKPIPTLDRTTDDGATWTTVYPPTAPTGPVAFLDANTGFGVQTLADLTSRYPVHHFNSVTTHDGGLTWQVLAMDAAAPPNRIDFPDSQHGKIMTIGGMSISDDGGLTWHVVQGPRPGGDYLGISFPTKDIGYISRTNGVLFVTHDGGHYMYPERWLPGHADANAAGAQFIDEFHGWAVAYGTLFATDDGAETWKPIPLAYSVTAFHLLPGGHAWAIANDCNSCKEPSFLLSTNDGGATWKRYNVGDLNPTWISFVDPAHGWLRAQSGLYRTTDSGLTWTQLN